jgi:hypothetical protein
VDLGARRFGTGSILGFFGQLVLGVEQLENRRTHGLGFGLCGSQNFGALRHHDHGLYLGEGGF